MMGKKAKVCYEVEEGKRRRKVKRRNLKGTKARKEEGEREKKG